MDGVPMIRRGDADRVNILPGCDVPKIHHRQAIVVFVAGIDASLLRRTPIGIDITNGDDPDAVIGQELFKQSPGLFAHADEAHLDAAVRWRQRTVNMGRKKERRSQSRPGGVEKAAAVRG